MAGFERVNERIDCMVIAKAAERTRCVGTCGRIDIVERMNQGFKHHVNIWRPLRLIIESCSLSHGGGDIARPSTRDLSNRFGSLPAHVWIVIAEQVAQRLNGPFCPECLKKTCGI